MGSGAVGRAPGAGGGEPLPRIPGYEVEAVIGRGATGVVYRARQRSVDRVVAIKVLHRSLVGTARAIRRLQREARTTARLAHPNIISAIDMGEIDGVWWYAMELVEGTSLRERLEEGGRLSEREALRTFIPLVDALQHAYENGVVHRDVKPANILLDRHGRALLVDLGLAFVEDDPGLTRLGGTLGTPHYISPEQARDPSSADTRSDIWSLGATMYHALCGRPPFPGRSVAEILSSVLYAHVEDPLRLAPNLSRNLALVLRKCLTRNPDRRYQRPAELLADLERIRERRQVKVRRASLDPVRRPPRALARTLGLAAALVLVLAGALWWSGRGAAVERGDAGAGLVTRWEPLERAVRRGAEDPALLAGALAELEQMLPTLPSEHHARWGEVQRELTERLDAALWKLRRDVEGRIAALVAEGEFASADALLERDLPYELASATGYLLDNLPAGRRVPLATWRAEQAQHIAAERDRALARLRTRLRDWFEGELLPAVRDHVAAGRWRDAQRRLAPPVDDWVEAAGGRREGFAVADLERVLEPWRVRRSEERRKLENAWWQTDRDLRARIEERASALAAALGSGAPPGPDGAAEGDAALALDEAWRRELAAADLVVEEMPDGLQHRALAAYHERRRELEGLQRETAAARGAELVAARATELAPWWRERRYGEIAGVYELDLRADPPPPPGPRRDLELARREALLCERLLERAAAGITARDGESLSVQVGAITIHGAVRAGTDPLHRPFGLALAEREWRLALRWEGPRPAAIVPDAAAPSPATTAAGELTVLVPTDVERLAGLPSDPARIADPPDRLVRALFRYHEGDFRAARETLESGPLPDAPDLAPLVQSVRRRLLVALAERSDARTERQARVRDKLELVRRERAAPHARETALRAVRELLREHRDALTTAEVEELHAIRAELAAEPAPATAADFRRIFTPTAVELLPYGRVRLEFSFAGAPGSAWEHGDWRPDGRGLVRRGAPPAEAELFAAASPRLLLRAPLAVAAGRTDVELVLELPPDVPPDLLVVSAAGFHVAFAAGRAGAPARCLVATTDRDTIVARVRAGEGVPWAGFERGATHEIRFSVQQEGGLVSVRVDGKDVVRNARLPSPKGQPESASVSVRALEPLRLVAATIEAPRR